MTRCLNNVALQTGEIMINTRKLGAYIGAGAVIFTLAGCADRNKNGQPDSVATEGEISNAAGAAANKVEPALDSAGNAISNAASSAGKAITNAGETAGVTSKVKAAFGANAGLKGSTIDVDTNAQTNAVTLKGSVASQAQKALAEKIAKQNAPGYKIANQLKAAK
jgi:osmotically-inducible protein OsmY